MILSSPDDAPRPFKQGAEAKRLCAHHRQSDYGVRTLLITAHRQNSFIARKQSRQSPRHCRTGHGCAIHDRISPGKGRYDRYTGAGEPGFRPDIAERRQKVVAVRAMGRFLHRARLCRTGRPGALAAKSTDGEHLTVSCRIAHRRSVVVAAGCNTHHAHRPCPEDFTKNVLHIGTAAQGQIDQVASAVDRHANGFGDIERQGIRAPRAEKPGRH